MLKRNRLLGLLVGASALAMAHAAQAQTISYTPLLNTGVSGPVIPGAQPGSYLVSIYGTFGGTTVTLVETWQNGLTATLGSYSAVTTTPPCVTVAANASVQAVVTGGAPSGLSMTMSGVGNSSCTPGNATIGAVTNAGTFPVQNTAATPAGGNIIGKVSAVDSAGTDATDTVNHAFKVNVVAGGAGGGAVFGAVANGGAAANPPVLLGGTLNAAGNGTVENLKINAAGEVFIAPNTNIIGKVGIDQTTPGTTNAVAVTNLPTTVDTNSGNKTASTLREVIATDQLAIPNWGYGATGATAPAGAEYMGANSSGNLTGVIQADTNKKIDITGAATTELFSLSAAKKIYITYYKVHASGAGTGKFVYGTGTACATGTTDIEGASDLTASDGASGGSGLGPVIVVPASNALCYVTTGGGVHFAGFIAGTQF